MRLTSMFTGCLQTHQKNTPSPQSTHFASNAITARKPLAQDNLSLGRIQPQFGAELPAPEKACDDGNSKRPPSLSEAKRKHPTEIVKIHSQLVRRASAKLEAQLNEKLGEAKWSAVTAHGMYCFTIPQGSRNDLLDALGLKQK